MLTDRRVQTVDRRQHQRELNGVPFKDSNGVTVRGERRFMPDRRSNNMAVAPGEQKQETA